LKKKGSGTMEGEPPPWEKHECNASDRTTTRKKAELHQTTDERTRTWAPGRGKIVIFNGRCVTHSTK